MRKKNGGSKFPVSCCGGLSGKGNIINSVLLRHGLTLIIVSGPRIWGGSAMDFPLAGFEKNCNPTYFHQPALLVSVNGTPLGTNTYPFYAPGSDPLHHAY